MQVIPDVKASIDAVKNLSPLVLEITKLFQTPIGWVGLVIILFWLILNKDFYKLFDLLGRSRRIRLEKLDRYLSGGHSVDPEFIATIQDLRDAHYFQIGTKIYAEKKFRDALIMFKKASSSEISWIHIRRALPFIHIGQGTTLTVRDESIIEKTNYVFNITVGYLGLAFAFILIGIALFSGNIDVETRFIRILSSLIPMIFGVFMISQNFPMYSARKIRKELAQAASLG